ncbi:MAG: hypothetical protein JJT89_01420 [Nitriliruptoraceae bacterium]|nr:hypothetical protein [Nitriliruptoraceae bacterium]
MARFVARNRLVGRVSLALVLALVLGACGGGSGSQPSSVEWRNVQMDLPGGWYLVEEEETRLSLSNRDINMGGEPLTDEEIAAGPPEDDESGTVGMFFTFEPNTTPDDWRRFVEQQEATLESDQRIELQGEVPATQLIYAYVTDGVPTREMVTVIPSRQIVVLSAPFPGPGDEDGPDIFLDYIDEFIGVLESASFGAPVLD